MPRAILFTFVLLLLCAPGALRADDDPPDGQGHTPDEMRDANRAAALLLGERLRRSRPDDHRLLKCVRRRDLLVVRGAYDHVEWVLREVGVPFAECEPDVFAGTSLRGVEIVIVNCPGRIGSDGALGLRRFVERGGLLFTTDWAVLNVIEKAFPRTVRYTRRPTRDDVVAIRVVKPEHLFLKHVLTGSDEHRWWLENQSYPIEILDRRRVEVLIDSPEMRRTYGSGPIAVTFRWGRGRVVHVVSHFYLQRTELRSDRDRLPASAFAKDLGFGAGEEVVARLRRAGLTGVPSGELRSAYSAQGFLANLLIEAKRAEEGVEPPEERPDPVVEPAHAVNTKEARRDAVLRTEPGGARFKAISHGLRLRVLGRRDGWAHVRTPAGDTGWLPADAIGE